MTFSWRQEAEALFAAGGTYRWQRAVRPAKASESGNTAQLGWPIVRKSSKKGFTLIEIMIVLVILSLLIGIVILSVGGIISRGQQTGYEGEDESIRTAVVAYYVANNEWPTSGNTTPPTDPPGAAGVIDMSLLTEPSDDQLPYLDSIPKSASDSNCPPDIDCTGHYIWSVGADARVTSACPTCPELTADGYQGVYP